MRDDYVPNEKYRNMFGVERNGYGCERVDLYLAQLEVAFKKIREDNRNLKRELSDQASRPAGLMSPEGAAQQDQMYIGQLQAQLAEEQEQAGRLHAQLAEEQEQNRRLRAQVGELRASQLAVQNQIAAASALDASPQQTESLIAQINALRGEADELRQQLRRQPSQMYQAPMPLEDTTSLIGKVLVEARQQAEDTLRIAQQEADQLTRKARQRAEELRAEYDRVYTQLQGISFSLRNVLKDGPDYKQRGEEFAAS